MPLKITSPANNSTFTITSEPAWPALQFKTDATLAAGQKLTWNWTLAWDRFSKRGTDTTMTNVWNAQSTLTGTLTAGIITNLGGNLTVKVTGPSGTAHITVKIHGTNPSRAEVLAFLGNQPSGTGFDKILDHEGGMKHFNSHGEPIKSFDNGYGMAQLTDPPPTFEQCWNWKLNIVGGLSLFGKKQARAIAHLSQNNRSYTPDQLIRETISLWNGGNYHVWSGSAWVRPSNIVCDTATGNIGWDMNDSENTGKTPAQLRARDSGNYKRGRKEGDHWRYFGICYADQVLR